MVIGVRPRPERRMLPPTTVTFPDKAYKGRECSMIGWNNLIGAITHIGLNITECMNGTAHGR
jgi:hypothetical protein